MSKKKQHEDQDPILSEGKTLEINGDTYVLRRLGLRDAFKVTRILGAGVGILANADKVTPALMMQVLVQSMSTRTDETLSLLADVMGIKRDMLEDPERFPMESIIDIFQAIAEHQDLQAFLSRIEALGAVNQEMQTASQKASKP